MRIGDGMPSGSLLRGHLQLQHDLVWLSGNRDVARSQQLIDRIVVDVPRDRLTRNKPNPIDMVTSRRVDAQGRQLVLLALVCKVVRVHERVRRSWSQEAALIAVDLVERSPRNAGKEPDGWPHTLRLVGHLGL